MFRNILVSYCLIMSLNESQHSLETGKSYKTGIRGVAGLTRKSIRKIPGHYGRAIRGNVGDAGKMKKAVMAIWKYRSRDHCGD